MVVYSIPRRIEKGVLYKPPLAFIMITKINDLVVTLICNIVDTYVHKYYYNRYSFPPNYLARYVMFFLLRALLKINGSLTRCKRFIN